MTRPVGYERDYPSPSPFSESRRNRIYDELFFTKAKEWKYEKEWRMLNERGDIEEPLPGNISAIIFGLRLPEPERKTIQRILPDIQYREAAKVPNQFKLRIVWL